MRGYFAFPLLILFMAGCTSQSPKRPPYKNPDLPVERRVEDLLSRMTLEEKFWQLFMIPGDLAGGKELYPHGIFGFQVAVKGKTKGESEQMLDYAQTGNAEETALMINEIQHYFVEETRLGIPVIPFDEALHGLVREGATVFPQAIGLAATWNTALMEDVAGAIAIEAKSRGIRQVLSPVLDIARDARWGRVEETYGEDPFMVSRMGVAFVSSFEKMGIITTPKHFIANNGEGGRDSYPVEYAKRLLEEVYYPPYQAVILEGGARSLMASYNSLDGRPCTANKHLLNETLKERWGFKGFVISDAGATGGSNVLHFITADYAESTREALENGLDVIFQTSRDHYPLFWEAFKQGMVSRDVIDNAVRRVLRAKFELGLFDNPYVDVKEAARWNGHKKHRDLAERAALESIVLLKNDRSTLPLSPAPGALAVIGGDATEARLGGYSGPGNNPVSILKGIQEQFQGSKVLFAPGCGRITETLVPVSPDFLFHQQGEGMQQGLRAQYFNNTSMSGTPALVRTDPCVNFSWTLYSPDPEKVQYDFFSVRWTGKLKIPGRGKYRIGCTGDDGYRLFLDGELLIDNWHKGTHRTLTVERDFTGKRLCDLRIEFYETVGNVKFQLVWDHGVEDLWQQKIRESVRVARMSDVAVVVAGIEEGEFRDRALLKLPGHQEELIRGVSETGTPTIVVIVGGSAVTMQNWIDQADAILYAWYPGEAGGNAVAKVLKGLYNPAGRLPITFPVHEGQLPLYYNHKPTGRGDDYMNLTGKPLFPFGFGLGYSSFCYSNMAFTKSTFRAGEKTRLQFTVTNTGKYDGDEVIQLYIKDLYASVVRPVLELKDFRRIHLLAGETRKVSFEITPQMLTMLDLKMQKVIEPGTFRVLIGASSNDIRLRGEITVTPADKK